MRSQDKPIKSPLSTVGWELCCHLLDRCCKQSSTLVSGLQHTFDGQTGSLAARHPPLQHFLITFVFRSLEDLSLKHVDVAHLSLSLFYFYLLITFASKGEDACSRSPVSELTVFISAFLSQIILYPSCFITLLAGVVLDILPLKRWQKKVRKVCCQFYVALIMTPCPMSKVYTVIRKRNETKSCLCKNCKVSRGGKSYTLFSQVEVLDFYFAGRRFNFLTRVKVENYKKKKVWALKCHQSVNVNVNLTSY